MSKDESKKTKKINAPIGHECFLDRELSWLEFNERVLNEAKSKKVPLLERLKFLSIYNSNLDEFFMVRVGSLIHRKRLFPDLKDEKTGWDTGTSIKNILARVREQQIKAEEIYRKLLKDLYASDIEVVDFGKINKVDESIAKKFFAELRPLITPMVVDGSHPIPFLSNRDTYVAALLNKGASSSLGIIPLNRLPMYKIFEINEHQKVVLTNELIAHFMQNLFKKYDVRETCSIRVTRNADVFLDESLAHADFKASMEKMLRKRKRELPVRLQIFGYSSVKMTNLISTSLKISSKYIFNTSIPSDLSFADKLKKKSSMTFNEQRPVKTIALNKGQFFKYLDKKDILLSFPYQSITPFIDLIYEAAEDPEVISIKITLYRLAATSKLAAALAYAADRGKDVLCLLELRARFDEQNNIDYSEMLESAGCHVIYGLQDMKVHSKVCLITRKASNGVKYITQVGTGNYNEVTSELYTDLSLITSRKDVGEDAAALFDSLALGEVPPASENLLLAPGRFRPWLLSMLEREMQKGPDGHVVIKANSMNDIDVMKALVKCSRAGVKVELFIRGICCLRPGLKGYTENITVKSVVGRHLEHSRIYMFGDGDERKIFIGSGDLLNRNTKYRVEAFVEVVSKETREQILEILDAFRDDNEKGSYMLPDGRYTKLEGGKGTSSQKRLHDYFIEQTIDGPLHRSLWEIIKGLF